MKAWITFTLLAGTSLVAGAQVGYPPDRSPYRDRDFNRDWTIFAGQFTGERDPVGVAPTDGPMVGVRWQMHLAGPMYFAARLAGGSVDRTIIDPSKRIAERVVGTEKVPMAFLDALLEVSLTGHKTWRGLSPFINGGLGLVADTRGASDVGDYRFGIPFTITAGGGLSWQLSRSMALRAELTNYIYRINYPTTYYLKTTEDPAVLPTNASRAFWRRNPSLQIGISLFRPR